MTSMECFNGGCTYIFCYVIFCRRTEPEPEDWSSYESSEVTDKSESNKPKKNVERMPRNGKRHRHKYEDSPEGNLDTFTVLKMLY